MEHDKLNNKIANVETRCEPLVGQLKEDLCRVISFHQEEHFLEVEEIRKTLMMNLCWIKETNILMKAKK